MNRPFAWHVLLGKLAFVALIHTPVFAAGAPPLPSYGADVSHTAVSGLSSGAFMAAQFHIAFSGTVVGAGIIAGGPFYCSGSVSGNAYLENAMNICMNPLGRGPDASKLVAKAKEFAQQGLIDPPENLKDDKVYLFSGVSDKTVTTKVVVLYPQAESSQGIPFNPKGKKAPQMAAVMAMLKRLAEPRKQ